MENNDSNKVVYMTTSDIIKNFDGVLSHKDIQEIQNFAKGETHAMNNLKIPMELFKDYMKVRNIYGLTHDIVKRMGTQVDMKLLKEGESVVWGDGETYHWLLKEKNEIKSVKE